MQEQNKQQQQKTIFYCFFLSEDDNHAMDKFTEITFSILRFEDLDIVVPA